MVKLILEDDRVGYELLPYTQNENEPGVYPKMGEAYNEWKSRFDAISEVVADRGKLEAKYKELLTKTERIYSTNLTPYASRFTLALYMRHLLPMLMSKRKLRTLLNMLMCESHYDRMMRMLKNYSK